MAMSASGLGSNLDIEGIVTQLMTVERQPLKKLDTREADVQAKISAFGSVKSALATLQNAVAGLKLPAGFNALDFYSTYQGSVANSEIATVTAGEGTVPGDYSLEVSQLAKQHRIASTPGATIGTGTLSIQLTDAAGSTVSKTTSVQLTSNRLTDIRDAINNANAGVAATIINGDGGAQLILTGESGGSNQFIKLSGVSGLAFTPGSPSADFTQQQPAQSALLKLNGIDVVSQTNTVTNAMTGVTLTLKKETTSATTVTLTRDTSGLNKALDKLVTAFNDFNKLSKELGGFNVATGKLGTLGGDTSLRSADARLRQILGSSPPALASASLKSLSDIGVELQRDGTLKLNSAKLEKALKGDPLKGTSADFVGVAKVAAEAGFALDGALKSLIGVGGIITSKTESLNSSVKTIELRRTELEKRLTDIEARYRKQYTALDTLVSGMLQTSNYLEQQLANLPSASA